VQPRGVIAYNAAMDATIQVNFNKPLPLFPLPDTVVLPHSVQQLHVFEERYRQMVRHALDQAGQIAMASPAEEEWPSTEGADTPALRSAVCVGQIMQHHRFRDGRYNVLVLGVCRAKIARIDEPEDDRLYRLAHLNLLERIEPKPELKQARRQLHDLLKAPTINQVRGMKKVMPLFDREDVPTQALLELIGSALLEDPEKRYALLAEPDPVVRARIIHRELRVIDRLIRSAQWQMNGEWPKGLSWN
jgi:Lon protease-like protein